MKRNVHQKCKPKFLPFSSCQHGMWKQASLVSRFVSQNWNRMCHAHLTGMKSNCPVCICYVSYSFWLRYSKKPSQIMTDRKQNFCFHNKFSNVFQQVNQTDEVGLFFYYLWELVFATIENHSSQFSFVYYSLWPNKQICELVKCQCNLWSPSSKHKE